MARKPGARRRPRTPASVAYTLTHLPLEARAVLAILLGALLLRLWALGAFSTQFEEGVYWQTLRAMANGHALYQPIFHEQLPFFLGSVFPLYVLFGQTLPAARFGVVALSLVSVVAAYALGRALGGRGAGLVAATLLAIDPAYALGSRLLLPEVPAICFALGGLALTLEATRRSDRVRQRLALAGGAALALGALIDSLAALALVPALLYLATPLFTSMLDRDGRPRMPASDWLQVGAREAAPDIGMFAAGLLGASLLVLLPYASVAPALFNETFGLRAAAARALGQGLAEHLGALYRVSTQGSGVWLALAALVGLGLALWRRAWPLLPLFLWLMITCVALALWQPLEAHRALWLTPPLALLAGMSVHLLPTRDLLAGPGVASRPHAAVTYGLLALLAVTLVAGVWGSIQQNVQTIGDSSTVDLQMTIALAAASDPSDGVITDDPYIAGLAGRNVQPEVVDTSLARVASGYLTASQLEAIVQRSDTRVILFSGGQFDAVPGFRAWVSGNYTQAATFGGGRALYIKQPSVPVPM